jgi:DNA-binding LacI/PurR family transcriptional regulator
MPKEVRTGLPKIDEQWFVDHSVVKDPTAAWETWQRWLGKSRSPDEWKLKTKLLEIAEGVVRQTISDYLSPTEWAQLGDETLWDLDYLADAIGIAIPPRTRTRSHQRPQQRGSRRILLMFDVDAVPSPRFHMEVFRSLVKSARARHVSLTIQGVGDGDDVPSVLARTIRLGRHEGVIWLRMTPNDEALRVLNWGGRTPAVVVHGQLREYQNPVIGHVFPDQSNLARETQAWAESVRAGAAEEAPARAVVVAMTRESGEQSLRNARVDAILEGLQAAGYLPRYEEVPDYSAGNAESVVSRWPSEQCYVCLSDEIAVSVAQLLRAHGRPSQDRVLGFDGSGIAGKAAVPSFSQSIEAIGDAVWALFESFFRRRDPDRWPPFEPRPVPLKLMH